MRTIFTSINLMAALISAIPCTAALTAAASESVPVGKTADPISLYGAGIDFDVYRNGKKVGYHQVRFDRIGQDLVVSSRFDLQIKVLFVTAYDFLYEAHGRWRDGQLFRLDSVVNDNGSKTSLAARRAGDRFTVKTTDGSYTAEAPLYPTSHWNVAVLGQNRVLNTLTGRVNNVAVEPRGREKVATEAGEVSATRYSYTGDLETDVWYDDAGRWVKLRFKARDGSVIDYACRRCEATHDYDMLQAER